MAHANSRRLARLAPAALLVCGLAPLAVRAAPSAASAAPMAVAVPFTPRPAMVGGQRRLFYEFDLRSFAKGDLVVDEVRVTDPAGGAVLNDIKGPALAPLVYRPGVAKAGADSARFGGGAFGVVYMETTLPAGESTPAALAWRITVRDPDPSAGARTLVDSVPIQGQMALDQRPAPVIGLPFRGGDWVAANGPSNTSGHRRALIVVDGKARISQRFAIDWVKLGPDGRLFHGDKAINANWYGFGVEVVAVADATVSAAHDGVPENEPSDKRAVPVTLETVGGNYLILDLGGGRYAFYAHLQPGSQTVRVGDKVRRGEVLGLLGNTGNSDAPHLHFHVSDANAPLAAEGVAYAFDAYDSLGSVDNLGSADKVFGGDPWSPLPGSAPQARRAALPAEDDVIRAP